MNFIREFSLDIPIFQINTIIERLQNDFCKFQCNFRGTFLLQPDIVW